jgi:LPS export ABC transporter protein LptC
MNFNAIKYKFQCMGSYHPNQWIKLGFILIAIGCLFGSCENDIAKIKQFSNNENLPDIAAEGYQVLYFDSTVIRSKLQTPEMIIYSNNQKEPYTEFPKGILILQYDGKMNLTSNITAQYAKYFQSEDRWEAKNNVVAVNQKGDTLKTEYLVWDKKKAKIYSDQFVKIIQKDGQVTTGTSFESNQDFSEYVIKNLKGKMYVDVQNK